MDSMKLFEEGGFKLQTVEVDGKPWFAVDNICDSTGKGVPKNVVKNLDEDEKNLMALEAPSGQRRRKWVVSEAGLYTLLLRSRDAVIRGTPAHRFRRWVTRTPVMFSCRLAFTPAIA